jgi:hypothetical protein
LRQHRHSSRALTRTPSRCAGLPQPGPRPWESTCRPAFRRVENPYRLYQVHQNSQAPDCREPSLRWLRPLPASQQRVEGWALKKRWRRHSNREPPPIQAVTDAGNQRIVEGGATQGALNSHRYQFSLVVEVAGYANYALRSKTRRCYARKNTDTHFRNCLGRLS